MADYDNFMKNYEAQQEKELQTALSTRRGLRTFLLGKGVEKVRTTYSGSGDSGAMEEIYIEGGPDDLKSEIVELEDGKGGTRADELEEVLRDMLWTLLHSKHAGWENNDGGQGEFEWDITSDELTLEHVEFYTESNSYPHEF
jgi:hypothetical protein